MALTMRTALRHIGDGIRWAGLDEESPGTGKRLAGAHSVPRQAFLPIWRQLILPVHLLFLALLRGCSGG